MTRKDYVLLARVLREGQDADENAAQIANRLARALKSDNPAFDADRFRAAFNGPVR